jgi:hypothetical protein
MPFKQPTLPRPTDPETTNPNNTKPPGAHPGGLSLWRCRDPSGANAPILPIPETTNPNNDKPPGAHPGGLSLWRCRESNPGPTVQIRDFSERSRYGAFSTSLLLTTTQRTRSQPLKMFRRPGWPGPLVSPLTTPDGAGTIPAERVTYRCQAARATVPLFCLAPIVFHRRFTRSQWFLGSLLPSRHSLSKPVTPLTE